VTNLACTCFNNSPCIPINIFRLLYFLSSDIGIREWTLAPGARLRVIGTADLGDVVQFHLEEVGTPFSLLQFEELGACDQIRGDIMATDHSRYTNHHPLSPNTTRVFGVFCY
jgi:hypothetical protein